MNWTDTSSPSVTGTSSSSITGSESASQSGTCSSSISGYHFLSIDHPPAQTNSINIGGVAAGSLAGLIVLIACVACIYQWLQRRRANA